MRVIMISTDRRIFDKGSDVRARMEEYGNLFDELQIIVFSEKRHNLPAGAERISEKVSARATNSFSRWFYIFDAFLLGRRIVRRWQPSRITGRLKVPKAAVTAQDPFECGLAGWLIARLAGFGLELQVHTDFLDPVFAESSFLNWIRFGLAKFILPKADSLRVVSDFLSEAISRDFNISRSRITILPIFVDAKAIILHRPAFDLKKRYPRFRFIILTLARLEPEKNVGLALSVLAEVVKKYPLTGLIVVGEGREDKELNDQARRLGIDNNVIFEGWQTDRISYLKTANALLVTSLYEGYGLGMVEAALAGCPVVTTSVGIAKEFRDGEEAFVCAGGDVKCLAGKIIRLIEDNETREFLRSRARAFFEERLPSKRKYLANFKSSIMRSIGEIE